MLIIKMMRDIQQNLADDDTRKPFRLISSVDSVTFEHPPENGFDLMHVSYGAANMAGGMPESFFVGGNVYIMNETGRTVSSYCPTNPMPSGGGIPQ